MSGAAAPSLAHRGVSGIRAASGAPPSAKDGAAPHTPLRTLSSTMLAAGSPSGGSGGRIEDDAIIIELGCRKVRVGFAGDPAPKRTLSFDTEAHRRTGDLRAWEAGYDEAWRDRMAGRPWAFYHELYQLDCRGQDLALVGDKLERGLRDAFARYLLIDSKLRRISLILPPALPLPLISAVLDTLFGRFQPPSISLLSAPCATAFAAGVRSALVVDLGWLETTVTAVYEYREVSTTRTIRAGKLLLEETRNFLADIVQGREQAPEGERPAEDAEIASFEDCEEVATRVLWCKKSKESPAQETASEGLPTLHEQDESEEVDPAEDSSPIPIFLPSCRPPRTVQVPFSRLSEPCETTFFQTAHASANFDDHELPVHLLVYLSLLKLPLDVRAVCMSRIIFTGGCSNILGLRGRIFDEVSLLAQQRGWDPMQGRGVDAYRNNPKLKRNGAGAGGSARPVGEEPIPVVIETAPDSPGDEEPSSVVQNPAHAPAEEDPVEEMIRKERNYKPPVQGQMRAIDTLGPWVGASMASHLKIPALAMVDREAWLLQGLGGASRPNEVDVQAQQKQSRQSMGGGLIRGQAGQGTNWTLGIFGAV